MSLDLSCLNKVQKKLGQSSGPGIFRTEGHYKDYGFYSEGNRWAFEDSGQMGGVI